MVSIIATTIAITGAVPFNGTDFGQSSREVFLIDFTCSGKENSLDECVFEGLGSGDMMAPTDCNYVGIRCMGKKILSHLLFCCSISMAQTMCS